MMAAADLGNRLAALSPHQRQLLDQRLAAQRLARAAEPIAVVGLACRFPGADNHPAFLELLRTGVDAITEVPADRWDGERLYDPAPATPGKMSTRWGGFLRQIDQMDCGFFGISPREAVHMDPQQRLLLEVGWEALEDAGIPPSSLAGGDTGVFVGIMTGDYGQTRYGSLTTIDAYAGSGNTHGMTANRLSYQLDLRGPSMAIDTACSSSLVAIHLACQSLRSGEASLALAGGVNILLWPGHTVYFTKASLMAADGRCKTFDARADGFVRGEGAGMVVLKPLAAAQADGDRVLAVIRGSAINQDGRSNGLTAPNPLAQEAVLRSAYRNAGISPAQVRYVEAHGTGTALGDPIETKALGTVLAADRPEADPCIIGSVKTNFGHLEAAAGIAGLIKAVLSLRHRQIFPHLHFRAPNPEIPFERLPLRVATSLESLPTDGPILVGVSSFGFGGTNAHVVLESAPAEPLRTETPPPGGAPPDTVPSNTVPQQLLALSARSAPALRTLAQRYGERLQPAANRDGDAPDGDALDGEALDGDALDSVAFADVCFSANTGRDTWPHRLAVRAHTNHQAGQRLRAFAAGQETDGIDVGHAATAPKIAFLFTGQGAQYRGMGRGLFDTEPVFRQALEACDAILRPHLPTPLLEVLYPPAPSATPLLDQTLYTQPALFALAHALVALWRSWGIVPSAVLGHSIGEYTAAHVAGAIPLEDGLRLIAERGRLMQALPETGGMVTVRLSPARLASYLEGHEQQVSLAAINGPRNVVLSGDRETLTEIVERLGAERIPARWLEVSHAFHSPLVEPMLEALDQAASTVTIAEPTIDLITNLSGTKTTSEALRAPDCWSRHARQPVRFMAGIETLLDDGYEVFVEIGPKPTLLGLAGRFAPPGTGTWLPSLRGPRNDTHPIHDALAALYLLGADIDWHAFHHRSAPDAARGRRVALPTYPFERQRYWLPASVGETQDGGTHNTGAATLLGTKLSSPALDHHVDVFEYRLGPASMPFLDDHRLFGEIVMPAAAWLIMASAVGNAGRQVEDLVLLRPLIIDDDGVRIVQLVHDRGRGTFQIVSREPAAPDTWTHHATGRLGSNTNTAATTSTTTTTAIDLRSIRARCTEAAEPTALSHLTGGDALAIGPRVQWLGEVWRRDGEAVARLVQPADEHGGPGSVHPGLVDSALRLLAAAVPTAVGGRLHLPFRIARYRQLGPLTGALWAHAALRPTGNGQAGPGLIGDLRVVDDDGRAVIEVHGLEIRPTNHPSMQSGPEAWLHQLVWRPASPLPAPASDTRHRWLIFADEAGLGSVLAEALRNVGGRTVEVYAGTTFECLGPDRWRLDPGRADEALRLLDEAASGDPWSGVIYLWFLDQPTPAADSEPAEAPGLPGLFHLGQSLAAGRSDTPPALWLITRGAQATSADDTETDPRQATGWGLAGVLGRELGDVPCRAIDLDPLLDPVLDPKAARDAQAFRHDARRLVTELLAPDAEDRVALRADTRWVARLIHGQPTPANEVTPVRPDACYLVTGGLGSLGLYVARWLVTGGARHLVLCGRGAPSAQAQATIRELERDGATVIVRAIDVTQADQVISLVGDLVAGPQPLAGVFHLAGAIDDALVAQLDWPRFHRVLAPKVDGAWNLHRATAELDLDLFVLFSSTAPLLSNPGQSSYAAANAFLDALAHHRHCHNLPALAIGWGPWAEGGMAADLPDEVHQQWRAAGIEMIDPAAGLALLDRMLTSDAAQLSVLPITWPVYLATLPASAASPLFEEVLEELFEEVPGTSSGPVDAASDAPPDQALFLDRLEATPAVEREALLAEHVRNTARRVLHLATDQPLDDGDSLIALGLDSLMALELRNALQADLDQPLPGTLIFDQPTVGQIVAFLQGLV